MISRTVVSGLNALPFTLQPRLVLDHARQRFEETHIVRNSRVEDDVGGVEIGRRWWLRRGRQRIERDPLSVFDRLRKIGIAAALQNRSQQRQQSMMLPVIEPPPTGGISITMGRASIARRWRAFRDNCPGVRWVLVTVLGAELIAMTSPPGYCFAIAT
jgi:hypothetical protein